MPTDLRTRKLAQLAVKVCTEVKPKTNVIISGGEEALPFIKELYKAVILAEAYPSLKVSPSDISDFFYKYAKEHQIKKFPEFLDHLVKNSQAYIGIDTATNTRELASADSKKLAERQKVTHQVSDYVCNTRDKIKRVSIAYPCQALAQDAEVSLTEYENFVYSACLQDWKKLKKSYDKIKSSFKDNSEVHLIGKNVDLKFRVHGSLAVSDLDTFENMPAGEVFMAPIKESLEGWIKFEYPAIEAGKEVTDISLKFEKGKVVEFDASKNKDFLKEMLEMDEGSSYVGEFGIGCNPKITKFTKNLLFDEKIGGTIHLALGMAYKENTKGLPKEARNQSNIHWDIVKNMSEAKIVLDGKTIQENGKWKIRGVKI